jgi:S-ribosylhomocysteine lyase
MKKIESFQVNHLTLERGMYISRVDGDITTYDIRMKKPNSEPVLENAALHTIEHLFATFVRNSEYSPRIIYFGPMGCRTGFYFLTRGLSHKQAVALTKRAFEFIAAFKGEIPGAKEEECGNFREHDLSGAKTETRNFLPIISAVDETTLIYKN